MTLRSHRKNLTQKPKLVRFLTMYFILTGIFFLVLHFSSIKEYSSIDAAYSNFILFVTHHILSLFQIQSSYQGTIISLQGVSLNVLFGCNGLEAVLIYSVAIISFPAPWKKKFIGIVLGFLIIQAFNIIRIVGLAYAAVNYSELFKILHIYVAQGIMIAMALGIFLAYLNYATREKQLNT